MQHYAILGMHAVFRLLENHRSVTFDDVIRALDAPLRWQAVHERRVPPGLHHHFGVYCEALEVSLPLIGLL